MRKRTIRIRSDAKSANGSRKLRRNARVVVRRFDPRLDSYRELTTLLHTAFVRLGQMDLNCTCVDQTEAVTRQRAEAGQCFVAVSGGRIVATMTVYERDANSACDYYHQGRVATVRQLGVDPSWQGRGLGKALLDYAERWAAARGYMELALDTPHSATHLVSFYRRQGFRMVRVMRFAGKVYESAIFAKALVVARTLTDWCKGRGGSSKGGIRFVAPRMIAGA